MLPPVGVPIPAKVFSSAAWTANMTSPDAVPVGFVHVNDVAVEVAWLWARYEATTPTPRI